MMQIEAEAKCGARKGGNIPFFISERKRSEQALIGLVQEAFINGVSNRKIERLAKRLGIENISASQVSEINWDSRSRLKSSAISILSLGQSVEQRCVQQ
jgi:transposase-like protein